MCNLYSVTKGQQAIREAFRAMVDRTGNLPPLPGNIAIISWRANRIKHGASLVELKAIVAYVEGHLAHPAPKKTKVRGIRVAAERNE